MTRVADGGGAEQLIRALREEVARLELDDPERGDALVDRVVAVIEELGPEAIQDGLVTPEAAGRVAAAVLAPAPATAPGREGGS